MRKFGPDLHVCDCEWANKGNTCKHVLKIIDILKRKTTNEHDHVVGKCHLKFRFSTYIHMNVYYCFPMLTKLFFFFQIAEASTPLVDDNNKVRESSSHGINVIGNYDKIFIFKYSIIL